MILHLETLLINQESIRREDQIAGMIDYVKSYGTWSRESLKDHAESAGHKHHSLIYIAKFPDGVEMIHDGHHRLIATWLAGRTFLHSDEYERHPWTYEAYNTINWEYKYVTYRRASPAASLVH
jgi:hypothetical protein